MTATDPLVQSIVDTKIRQFQLEAELRRRERNREKARRSPRGRYLHPKPKSLVVRLLDLIEEKGGMTPSQMTKQLWQWSYPDIEYDPKKGRGRWGTHLYGDESLLRFYCKKVGKKWVRNGVDHEGEPWRVLRAKSRRRAQQYKANWSVAPNYMLFATHSAAQVQP